MASFETDSLFNVKNKVALVTGGSRGIGKMIATGLIANGVKVYITSRTARDCAATAEELNKLGPGECIPMPFDLQKIEDVHKLVSQIQTHEKVLHILVNNAGAVWGADIDDHPDAAFTKVLTLNLHRVFNLIQLCLPMLREAAIQGGKDGQVFKDPARIINIGSTDGINVPANQTYSYSAAKAGLHHLSRHLAGRLGDDGVTCNTIACGAFESKMMAFNLKTQGDAIKAYVPLHRFGTPEDIAGAVLFLASRAGAYVTGATIALDGGYLVSMGIRIASKL